MRLALLLVVNCTATTCAADSPLGLCNERAWEAARPQVVQLDPPIQRIPTIGGRGHIRRVSGHASTLWKSLDTSVVKIATIGEQEVEVEAVGRGIGKVIAVANGVADTAVVVVGDLAYFRLSPRVDTITAAGDSVRFEVVSSEAGAPVEWSALDPDIVAVGRDGVATGIEEGAGRIVARHAGLADTVTIVVRPRLSRSLADRVDPTRGIAGPLIRRRGNLSEPLRSFDANFIANEQGRYNTWVTGGRNVNVTVGDAMHYGALRSRYEWSVRYGLPVGPSAPPTSMYARGRELVRHYLVAYSAPNDHKTPPHGNTAMADIELLYVLENDRDALAHLTGVARYYGALYIESYFDLSGPQSDPRSSAILLQAMSAADRHGIPYSGRDSWGSSWREAAAEIVGRIDRRVGSDGKVVSQAHRNSGQGEEAFFMNAMLATELLRWHGYVEPRPAWVELARRIVDHLIDEDGRRPGRCLPYTSNGGGCASDLAAFYVWPSLVLWQETGQERYRTWALANLRATEDAYLGGIKQFNQVYSTGAQAAEALLSGVPWR